MSLPHWPAVSSSVHRPQRNESSSTSLDTPHSDQAAALTVQDYHYQQGQEEQQAGDRKQHQQQQHNESLHENETDEAAKRGMQKQTLSPFFVLVKDVKSREFYHPTVHYIFADDDDAIVTEAAVRSAEESAAVIPPATSASHEPDPATSYKFHTHSHDDEPTNDEEHDHISQSSRPSLLPPPTPGVQEHYIILDVALTTNMSSISDRDASQNLFTTAQQQQTSSHSLSQQRSSTSKPAQQLAYSSSRQSQTSPQFQIVSAKSLSPTFQILDTRLSIAPTLASSSPDEGSPTTASAFSEPDAHNVMLQIHGTPGIPIEKETSEEKPHGGSSTMKRSGLEEMMAQLKVRMEELNRVVEMAGDESVVMDERDEET
ncbi:ubiquitin-protein ligase Anaphase Promoting Complex [Ascosphaera aggregata]|nr:ubiquitin-protein ligase Anaphase Promoting Complex [Ascosphaera aggregata]